MRSAALTVALLVLLVGSTPAVSVALAPPSGPSEPVGAALDDSAIRPQVTTTTDTTTTDTTITVSLRENGDARWNVTFVYPLDSANETAAFERYATAFEAGETSGGLDPAIFESLASSAADQTDRPMAIENVSRNATMTNSTGRLSLSFTWTNFLRRTGETSLQFNDAVLIAGNETWLSSLDPSQTLVIRPPPGHSVTSTELPAFDLRENAVVIEGPQTFDGAISITYERTNGPVEQQVPWEFIVPAIVAAAALVGGAILLTRRGAPTAIGDATPTSNASNRDDGPDSPPADGVGAAGGESPGDADGVDEDDESVDLSLLSDEERVERLLDQAGGRMKQATIVTETGWSDAKVSQLLSAMADAGRVEKLRLGRENLISLPDDEDSDTDER